MERWSSTLIVVTHSNIYTLHINRKRINEIKGGMVLEPIWRRSHFCETFNQYINLRKFHSLKFIFLPLRIDLLLSFEAWDCKRKSTILGPFDDHFLTRESLVGFVQGKLQQRHSK